MARKKTAARPTAEEEEEEVLAHMAEIAVALPLLFLIPMLFYINYLA